jgi:aryl-alcohol dehydrogenase-like predicted oxidoreductase
VAHIRAHSAAVANVLFGATSPAQIAENVAALGIDAATVQRIAG